MLTILPSSSTRAILLASRTICSCIPLKAIQYYIKIAVYDTTIIYIKVFVVMKGSLWRHLGHICVSFFFANLVLSIAFNISYIALVILHHIFRVSFQYLAHRVSHAYRVSRIAFNISHITFNIRVSPLIYRASHIAFRVS